MKPLVAILTGLHVLAHGVFGCCDHGLTHAARVEMACACHHDEHDHAANPPSSSDCEAPARLQGQVPAPTPHECAHASCHWVAGSAGPSIAPIDFSAPVLVVAVAPLHRATLQSADSSPDDVLGRTSAPPLRLHLALGVIVI